jgi:hypothetical protein
MRVPGDLVFSVGVGCIVLFVAGLAWPRRVAEKAHSIEARDSVG